MSRLLSLILAVSLLAYPFATFASDYGSLSSQYSQDPPVAQTLVREGDFAIKLAGALGLGSPGNEAEAEDMLARAGIAPSNGWLSDYPVTAQILGQLDESIAGAADAAKLPMSADVAKKGLTDLAVEMNLPLPAGPGNSAEGNPSQANSTTVNNYYYDQGPPVITYYAPPPDYFYLYDWVPFPVVWFGFWFPGFFICHNFTTVVARPFVGFHARAIVTNRVIDRTTRRVAFVDPVARTRGPAGPATVLRTGSGRTFRSMTELRRASGLSSHQASPQTGSAQGVSPRSGWTTKNTLRNGSSATRAPQGTFGRSSVGGTGAPRIRERSSSSMRSPATQMASPKQSMSSPGWNGTRQYERRTAPQSFPNGSWQSRRSGGFGHSPRAGWWR